ncbi:hypothetical protein SDC9_127864 [bioreactor metagenome]|uniref:Uncharacterized protein n=1 Tax=bioreactor metagenome TaxID=1076179 RepID=A0A645CV85_9ZZZZ
MPVVEQSHVAGAGRARRGHGRLAQQSPGQLQVAGKVVGGSRGDIAQRCFGLSLQQTGNHLAEGPVTPGAHHPVKVRRQLGGHARGIPRALGGIRGYQIARLGKYLQASGQLRLDDALSRMQIVNKQQLFHDAPPCGAVAGLARFLLYYSLPRANAQAPNS